MKITDKLSIKLDYVVFTDISDANDVLVICDSNNEDWKFRDCEYGKGFCKNLKAKIDAYFEAKEDIVIYQAARLNPGHHDVEKYYEDEI